MDWYRKAAEQNEPAAQYSLGLMYEQGTGVPRNLTEANRWYQLAAKNGDPDAKAALRTIKTPAPAPAKAAASPTKQTREKKKQ